MDGAYTTQKALFRKVIITKLRMDLIATIIALWAKVWSLLSAIALIRHVIPKFNTHMKQIVEDLATRGKTAPDLTDHLICAYLDISHSTFVK